MVDSHDPLCPQATIYSGEWEPDQRHWSCHCDIIAKVRADERQRIIGVMERNADGDALKVIDAVLDMV